jgi:hypothetical protein
VRLRAAAVVRLERALAHSGAPGGLSGWTMYVAGVASPAQRACETAVDNTTGLRYAGDPARVKPRRADLGRPPALPRCAGPAFRWPEQTTPVVDNRLKGISRACSVARSGAFPIGPAARRSAGRRPAATVSMRLNRGFPPARAGGSTAKDVHP